MTLVEESKEIASELRAMTDYESAEYEALADRGIELWKQMSETEREELRAWAHKYFFGGLKAK